MAEDLTHVKGKDLKDLKVVELKKELHERGLSITGNKSDLIARLEEYLLKQGDDQEEIEVEVGVFDSEIENIGGDLEQEISEDTFDEQDSGAESKNEQSDEKTDIPTENIPPSTDDLVKVEENLNFIKTVEKPKTISLDLPKTDKERKIDRQQRFGVPLNEKQKKLARAERFGGGGGSNESQKNDVFTKDSPDIEKLSKRAERFGAVSPIVTKTVEEDKIKKRKERFGVSTSGLSSDVEARKKMRADRFKQA
ncbi:SAP domain-containing ribonucleoprotein-like [Dendronephthya gigantea]|uniref:SAP domain-containing ribonucleoprotein-like n=1 Tax=Dendronephthya gigantea TaxID=151771 RepID=UPI00106D1BFD|nr:SAP domain-containing ribonucleoprotein-like [Dendronephthya gigantea]